MPRPRARLTTRRLMLAAAVVAACLSFAARADRLRSAASARAREASARLVRSHGTATPEDWRAYRAAQDDLLKADFLESFGVVVGLLVAAGAVVLFVRSRRRPRPGRPDTPGQTAL